MTRQHKRRPSHIMKIRPTSYDLVFLRPVSEKEGASACSDAEEGSAGFVPYPICVWKPLLWCHANAKGAGGGATQTATQLAGGPGTEGTHREGCAKKMFGTGWQLFFRRVHPVQWGIRKKNTRKKYSIPLFFQRYPKPSSHPGAPIHLRPMRTKMVSSSVQRVPVRRVLPLLTLSCCTCERGRHLSEC